MEFSLAQVRQATHAQFIPSNVCGERNANGWSIDSRTVQPGDLFFAIKGEYFDGHAFTATAFERGAVAAIVSEPISALNGPLLLVADTLNALQELAQWARREWARPIVAVTGSAGKTSTKDIIAELLGERLRVGKTTGNLNNHLGLPLTLLRIPEDAEVAVVELGMNHAGEIRHLAELAEPQYGVVTNVGFAHVESFRSIDEVAAAKRELIETLPADGVAILNADDARVRTFGDVHPGRTFTYGFSAGADLQATDVEITSTGAAFTAGRVRFHTSLSGRHGVSNVLAGLAVARLFGIALIDLVDAVARLKLGHMRGERHHWRGMTVLNDAYNSNPEAARNMIDVLCGQHPGKMAGRRIAVLGEMRELGHMSRMLHGELGRYAVRAGVNILIGVAGDARYMVDAAVDSGFAREAAFFFDDAEAAGAFLREFTAPGDVLLFKGSRGTHVERALDKMET